jgi:SM-20-related protein
MPAAEFFSLLRLFVQREFFPPEECETLRREARLVPAIPGTVRTEGSTYVVDGSERSVRRSLINDQVVAQTTERLLALKPRLETYFGIPLRGCQPPQFLIYGPGDHYRAHRDSSDDPMASLISRERRVSIVIFLNGESAEPRASYYGGGALTFYGLLDDPRTRSAGLPLVGEPGLLIAFPSHLAHGVTPVTHGERFTVVSWFI